MKRLFHWLKTTARLMVGVPDYEVYLAHLRAHHADRKPMTYEEFFRDRQNRRYGSSASRCC